MGNIWTGARGQHKSQQGEENGRKSGKYYLGEERERERRGSSSVPLSLSPFTEQANMLRLCRPFAATSRVPFAQIGYSF